MMVRYFFVLATTLLFINEGSSTENVNNDGEITWAPLPEGQVYSDAKFDGDRFPLDTTWNSIDGFLKFISPGDPPYEIISDIIGGEFDTSEYEPIDYYDKFKDSILGFMVLFVIGIIFIVVFPIIALCFCCCRCCCHKCGGKMEQKSPSSCMCCYLVIGLLICCAFILGGVGTAYSLNSYTADSVETFADDLNSNIDNIVAFVENTNDELAFLVGDQLNYTLEQLKIDLNDIGNLVGIPVRDILNDEVGAAIDAVKDLATNIDDTYDQLALVNSTQDELAALYVLFEVQIALVKSNIDTNCSSCSCCDDGGFPDQNNYVSNVDYRDLGFDNGVFPQQVVDESLVELQDLKDEDLASVAAEGEQTFLDIPETLTNSTQEDIDSISDNIDGFQDDIQAAIDDLTSELDSLTDETDSVSADIDSYGQDAQDYDQYRVYTMAGIFGLILIVPVLWLLGMTCGLLGRSANALPTERGCISNCGGCLLMTGAAVVFLLGTLLMALTTFPFIIGGPVDRLFCDPFQSGDAFKETIDKPDGIPGVEGYYLADLLLNDSSIELTVSGVLDACENNDAIYTAFSFEYIVNISQYLDYKQYMPDIDSQFENITGDFTDIDILPASGVQTLEDFANSSVISINFTLFKNQLDRDITLDLNDPDDLSVSADAIITYITTHSKTGSDADALTAMAGYLTDLQDDYIEPMITKKAELKTALTDLEDATSLIENSVDSALDEIDAAQNSIDNTIDSLVTDEVSSYSDRVLGYAEQYVNYVNNQVQNEVGRCLPVYRLYEDSLNLICVSLLQSWNSLWFCIGWCLFFMLAGLVYSVKLSKYLRRMNESDDDYSGMEMTNVNQSGQYGARMNANKVHPHGGYAQPQDNSSVSVKTASTTVWEKKSENVVPNGDTTITVYEMVDTAEDGVTESLAIAKPLAYYDNSNANPRTLSPL